MGALNRLMGSPKEIDIDGNKILLHPIKVKDMAKVSNENPTPEEALAMARNIIKLSIEDTNNEEIDELPLKTYLKILDEVYKLNGFENEKAGRIKAAVAARQKQ